MKASRLLRADSLQQALIELTLIVVGILIALFLDGWWEDRNERDAERAALAEIARDLVGDAEEANIGLKTYGGYRDFGVWWDQHRGQDLDAATVEPMFALLAPIHLYQPQSASYVGLRSSGRLGIISNDELRADLVRYFEHSQAQIVQLAAEMRLARQRLDDAMELDLIIVMGGDPKGPPPLALLRPWSAVPSDPRLPARIRALAGRAEQIINNPGLYNEHLRRNESLRERIREELVRADD
jgi:hypothetical protein